MSFDKTEKLNEQDKKNLVEFVQLSRQKKKLNEDLKQINAKITALAKKNGTLLTVFQEHGIDKIQGVEGDATVYIKRSIFPALFVAVDGKELSAAELKELPAEEEQRLWDDVFSKLSDSGYEDAIKHVRSFDAKELAKEVREILKEDPTLNIEDALPHELKNIVKVYEDFSLVCRG